MISNAKKLNTVITRKQWNRKPNFSNLMLLQSKFDVVTKQIDLFDTFK